MAKQRLFRITLSISQDVTSNLNNGRIPKRLKDEYEKRGYTLSNDEHISIRMKKENKAWELYDETKGYHHRIEYKNLGAKLSVYGIQKTKSQKNKYEKESDMEKQYLVTVKRHVEDISRNLNDGNIPNYLKNRLEKKGYELPEDEDISLLISPNKWELFDLINEQKFEIRKERGKLIVDKVEISRRPQEKKKEADKLNYCIQCGYEVDDDAIYCEKCGHKRGEKKKEVDKLNYCTQCGYEVDDNAIYCEKCGHKRGEKKKEDVREEHERKKDYQPPQIQRKESSDGLGQKGLVIGIVAIIIIGILVVIALNVRSGKEVKVIYEGSWSGAIVDSDGSRSISGSGTETFSVDGTVSANAQKMDGSSQEITIQIIENGNVVEEQSTTSAYGIVSVTG